MAFADIGLSHYPVEYKRVLVQGYIIVSSPKLSLFDAIDDFLFVSYAYVLQWRLESFSQVNHYLQYTVAP